MVFVIDFVDGVRDGLVKVKFRIQYIEHVAKLNGAVS